MKFSGTHLESVASSLYEARQIAKDRLDSNPEIPWWDIRREGKEYYVVPPRQIFEKNWEHDPGYESVGAFVERVYRQN